MDIANDWRFYPLDKSTFGEEDIDNWKMVKDIKVFNMKTLHDSNHQLVWSSVEPKLIYLNCTDGVMVHCRSRKLWAVRKGSWSFNSSSEIIIVSRLMHSPAESHFPSPPVSSKNVLVSSSPTPNMSHLFPSIGSPSTGSSSKPSTTACC